MNDLFEKELRNSFDSVKNELISVIMSSNSAKDKAEKEKFLLLVNGMDELLFQMYKEGFIAHAKLSFKNTTK